MKTLEINRVNKSYGSVQALYDVTLSVEGGEFVTLLGPSGSGKTTLLKALAGFEQISSGQILLGGEDFTSLPPERRNFGVVFQGYALFPHMSVYDNVAYPLRARGDNRRQIKQAVTEMLDLVQLGEFSGRKPATLSGGQQQRVALARALVFKPEVLLLDEPMSAIDRKLRDELQQELRSIHQTLGTTFINVTHDQEEAIHMSDRIAVINDGKIEQVGTPHELYRNPKTSFVATFIGKSKVLEGVIETSGTDAVFKCGSQTLRLDGRKHTAGKAHVMIRPEDIEIRSTVSPDKANSLRSRVVSYTYSGDRALYVVDIEGIGHTQAYGSARELSPFSDGGEVIACFSPQDCVVIG